MQICQIFSIRHAREILRPNLKFKNAKEGIPKNGYSWQPTVGVGALPI
jgi:hypothetical protein